MTPTPTPYSQLSNRTLIHLARMAAQWAAEGITGSPEIVISAALVEELVRRVEGCS